MDSAHLLALMFHPISGMHFAYIIRENHNPWPTQHEIPFIYKDLDQEFKARFSHSEFKSRRDTDSIFCLNETCKSCLIIVLKLW